MINHELGLIFVHIPCTAGTSIEAWIQGDDQWSVKPEAKHLTAFQAKSLYRSHWSSYFKFSIIRDPVDRFISMLRFPAHFGVRLDSVSGLDITGCIEKFGFPVTIEHDHRFASLDSLELLASGQGFSLNPLALYGNILGEEMDCIYCYEDLDLAVAELSTRFGLNPCAFPRLMQSDTRDSLVIGDEVRELISLMHSKDSILVRQINGNH